MFVLIKYIITSTRKEWKKNPKPSAKHKYAVTTPLLTQTQKNKKHIHFKVRHVSLLHEMTSAWISRHDIVEPTMASVSKSNTGPYLPNENMAYVVLVRPFISSSWEKKRQIKLSRHLKSTDRPNLLAASSPAATWSHSPDWDSDDLSLLIQHASIPSELM